MNWIKAPRKGGVRDTLVKKLGEGVDLVQHGLDALHEATAEGLGIEKEHANANRRNSQANMNAFLPQEGQTVVYTSTSDHKDYQATVQAVKGSHVKIQFGNGKVKDLSMEDFLRRCRPAHSHSETAAEEKKHSMPEPADEVEAMNRKVPKVPREKVKEALALCRNDKELTWKVLTLSELFLDVPLERIKATLDNCAGDRELASEALLRQPPNIRKDPEGWFRHFDLTGRGWLGKEDVIEAVRYSFPGMSPDAAEFMLGWMWESIDVDANGMITYEEFLYENGLRDLIVGEMKSRQGGDRDDDDDEGDDSDGQAGLERQTIKKALDKLTDKGALGVYFAASLARPFVGRSNMLQERYTDFKAKGIDFQVLVVSVDETETAYNKLTKSLKQFEHVPFRPKRTRCRIVELLDVQTVPGLIIMDKNGEVTTNDGLRALQDDEDGEHFPWRDMPAATSSSAGGGPTTAPKQTWRLVDDAEMEERAATMPLTQEGFQEVVGSKSIVALRQFLRRIIATKDWQVLDDVAFSDYIWDQASSAEDDASLGQLLEDMAKATWISTEPPAREEEEMQHVTSTTADGVKAESLPITKTSIAASAGSADSAQTEPAPTTEDQAAATPAAAPAGKGKAKGPPGKGPGKGPPPVPLPSTKAAEPAADAADAGGAGAAPAAGGKGKKGPPPPGGKGPPAPAGKGPPTPAGKGGKGPAAPAAKGGKAGGKAKGGKGGGLPPTREDKKEWIGKRTPKLRWKRFVRGEEGLDKSMFGLAEWEEGSVAVEELAAWAEDTKSKKKASSGAAAKKVVKPILWEPTERQDASKRRMAVAFMMKGKWKDFGSEFLELLKEHDLLGVMEHDSFEADSLSALADLVITITPTEWEHLADPLSHDAYDWDDSIEGFFHQLHQIPKSTVLLQALNSSINLKRQIEELSDYMTSVEDSLVAIRDTDELREVCLKILCIGNYLNAGEEKLSRADGFDVIDLVEGQLLKNLPKAHGVALIAHLRDVELSSAAKASFKELAEALDGWKPLGAGEVDPADIGEFKNEIGRISRALGACLESLRGAFGAKLQGKLLEFQDGFKEHRSAIDDIMTRLDELPETLAEVQNLVQQSKKDENVGRILRAMARFAHDLGSGKPG